MTVLRGLLRGLQHARTPRLILAATGCAAGVFALIWFSHERYRLSDIIDRLPNAVVAVRIERGVPGTDPLTRSLASVLPLNADGVPRDMTPVAIVYLDVDGVLSPLALIPRSALPRNIAPPSWRGFAVYGASPAVERLVHALPGKSSGARATVARLLPTSYPHLLFVRQSLLERVFPVLPARSAQAWDAIAWSGDTEHLALLARRAEAHTWLSTARLQLPTSNGTPLLAIDGVPAHILLPDPFPPLVHALLNAHHLAAPLHRLRMVLGASPVSLHVVERGGRIAPVIIAALPRGGEEAAGETIQQLFRDRLRELHATPTRVLAPDGSAIRHRRPASDPVLEEERLEEGILFRAPCGARLELAQEDRERCAGGHHDLVALLGSGRVIGGVSKDDVVSIAHALAEKREHAPRSMRVVLDLSRLEGLPIVDRMAARLPTLGALDLRSVRSIALTLRARGQGAEADGFVAFQPVNAHTR